MNANTCDFSANIRSAAAALGRQPTADQVEHLNLAMQTLAIVDPETKSVSMPAEDGTTVDVVAFLNQAATRFVRAPETAPVAQSDMVRFETGNSTSYRRADDGFVAITRAFQAAEAAQIAAQVATWNNPWHKGQENRTHQTVISKTNPTLAAKFKADAGV